MGRIYLNSDKYFMQTRSGDVKVAFDNKGLHGQELKDALQSRSIDIHLDGWWEEDIIADLLDSGLIPDEIPLQKEKNGQIIHWGSTHRFVYYLHVDANMVLELDTKTVSSTDDEWGPNRAFTKAADTSLDAAKKMWDQNPQYWKPASQFERVWVDGGFNRKGFYTVRKNHFNQNSKHMTKFDFQNQSSIRLQRLAKAATYLSLILKGEGGQWRDLTPFKVELDGLNSGQLVQLAEAATKRAEFLKSQEPAEELALMRGVKDQTWEIEADTLKITQ
jgi:hypothetical protein